MHNAPTPELEKIDVDDKKKYNEDFIFSAQRNTMNMLRDALRKNDHQLEAPLYLGVWIKKSNKAGQIKRRGG